MALGELGAARMRFIRESPGLFAARLPWPARRRLKLKALRPRTSKAMDAGRH